MPKEWRALTAYPRIRAKAFGDRFKVHGHMMPARIATERQTMLMVDHVLDGADGDLRHEAES